MKYRQAVVTDESPLTIPIRLVNGDVIGSLCAVTNATLQNDAVVSAFTRWRATYGRFFLTQFDPTPERTRNWLRAILADERRMLFTIMSGELLVGHYGFRDLDEKKTAELDNLLRGERGGHPRLMQSTIVTLSTWLFSTLGVATVVGNILADNLLALKLHTDVGFVLASKRPLTCVKGEHETRWTIGEPGHSSPRDRYYQQVVLHAGFEADNK